MEDANERGDLRNIYTDAGGMAHPSMQRDLGGEVWALVGPIGDHTSHPELQDALALVSMEFNQRHGRLSPEKHLQLAGNRSFRGGLDLLRDAVASAERALLSPPPTAPPIASRPEVEGKSHSSRS